MRLVASCLQSRGEFFFGRARCAWKSTLTDAGAPLPFFAGVRQLSAFVVAYPRCIDVACARARRPRRTAALGAWCGSRAAGGRVPCRCRVLLCSLPSPPLIPPTHERSLPLPLECSLTLAQIRPRRGPRQAADGRLAVARDLDAARGRDVWGVAVEWYVVVFLYCFFFLGGEEALVVHLLIRTLPPFHLPLPWPPSRPLLFLLPSSFRTLPLLICRALPLLLSFSVFDITVLPPSVPSSVPHPSLPPSLPPSSPHPPRSCPSPPPSFPPLSIPYCLFNLPLNFT